MADVLLGIDFGEARLGVAVSDSLGMLAHPLETVPNQGVAALDRIIALARERHAVGFVIGLPRHMNGSEGESAKKARAFAETLGSRSGLPIHFVDERLTTVGAQRLFQDAGINTKKSRGRIDVAAAQLILQGYLDARAFEADTL